ncbi:uncharacterized protein LOC111783529 [Cucurbita pepo subsp. pepo]|uniref:uncharacterized protein LOC111783529 n=1 Tax=Cucurbita pepo subsp. pepo TaxID=3664 RepID=UPI000C9D8F1A|nr:uncharacterized protein LOC111783529 [Cucurbita pepo subsp. pepo]
MDVEQVLNLFDSFWFEREIFNKHPFPTNPQNPRPENQDLDPLENSPPEEAFVPRICPRSISEDLSSKLTFMSDSSSPDSVLFSPKLQTILSSQDMGGEEAPEKSRRVVIRQKRKQRRRIGGRSIRGSESRSLSELEFEEVKGFMDLGFVFSEGDKSSSLAWIVPGLNRLGKRDEEEEELGGGISRPYLSEAWAAMEEEEELKKALVMKWRLPANEIDMKDNLKWWAHAVASTVR